MGEGAATAVLRILLGHPVEAVLVVAEVREAPLHYVQALLLLLDAGVDALPPVEGAIMQECQEVLEVLNELDGLFILWYGGRTRNGLDELIIALHLDHQRRQLQVEQQDVLLDLHSAQNRRC